MLALITILIVKTSSLGDIIQAFGVLEELHRHFPSPQIDWAVEEAFDPIVSSHPLVRKSIPLEIKGLKIAGLKQELKKLRSETYDYVFDLQGNCKSGIVTFFARGKTKIGYSFRSVREWPNILATHVRFHIPKNINIRLYYTSLIQTFFKIKARAPVPPSNIRFKINAEERNKIDQVLSGSPSPRVMVCPGSKWPNKQLSLPSMVQFLQKIRRELVPSFFLVWGTPLEKTFCEAIQAQVANAKVVDKLTVPAWQNLMAEMDLLIAVDSSALHLCSTTKTPSFSLFGPTASQIFKPPGPAPFCLSGDLPLRALLRENLPHPKNLFDGLVSSRFECG